FHGIGSGLSAGDTGVFLHNRGAGFNVTPGHPNEMAPGKRPLHTLSPTLWTRDGDLSLILGTRGGKFQPQLLVQVAASLFYAGLDPSSAQAAPRWALPEFGPDTESVLQVEPGIDAAGLDALGHTVTEVDGLQEGWGPVSMIVPGVGGAADPRVSTAAVATT
ncbi:MAG: gamma-glutamyltranspeptidase, partial [Acidimicrobiia bacterium]|nr:gamma-glutamyltranspeptidase [Acidimicrobiia bacterium]